MVKGGIFAFMNDFDEFKTASGYRVMPIVDTMPADLLTPLAVYLKLSRNEAYSFLLESVEGGETLARYSFIGAGPEFTISGNGARVRLNNGRGERSIDQPLFEFLRKLLGHAAPEDSELPSFIGGAIGYLGFPCADWFEPSLQLNRLDGDDARFMFFLSIVAFDHAKQVIKLISIARSKEGSTEEELQHSISAARDKNRALRKKLETAPLNLPDNAKPINAPEVRSNWPRSEFESAVRKVKELIIAGECYQVVLSQRFSRPTTASPIAIYRALRSLNPSPYMFLLNFADEAIIGASPEMLVRCRGRELEYRPIAGTRARGKSTDEDELLASEMRCDKKEVAEHMMLVDLGRNDIGRVAEYGGVKVTSLMQVEKYSHVQHLVSAIEGKLRVGLDRFDALAACFPAGTVSGAPKVRAIEIISELEPSARGIYSGAVGYFDFAGNMDTCIAIRTLVLKNGVASVQAGAGIVADSVPEKEFEETVNKAAALIRTIEIAESGGF